MRAVQTIWRHLALALAALGLLTASPATAQDTRSRVLVLTDIGNEPDDAESMVRFLVYANAFDIEGLLATTSRHQRTTVRPDMIRQRVAAYGEVLPNLRAHADGWPSAEALDALIVSGRAEYGMAGVGEGKDTDASRRIIEVVDADDARPVWVLVWGGAVDLAQALWTVRETRTPEQVEAFVAKLRVYSISDQDDAGPWVRRYFPDVFWIVSLHAHRHYMLATWTGISGEGMYRFEGPDPALVSNEWLETNIRRGTLGALYPPWTFIMEGDTPSFLYLIPNGLGLPERPDYGSWGGRYGRVSAWDNIWTDISDLVVDRNGVTRQTGQATIWRWREAYQNDFAARIGWTLSPDRAAGNHAPTLVLNGEVGIAPVRLSARPGDVVRLDAAGSADPDGDMVTYRWWQYRDAAATNRNPEGALSAAEGGATAFTVPAVGEPLELHVVLEARDGGTPALYSYRRAVISVTP
ncbi:MAG: DUF1593 domain-containing protein [Brevundimonas sp.]|nr:MAG: DUF1593 domain-containing protein [Brevundimonas sp.]